MNKFTKFLLLFTFFCFLFAETAFAQQAYPQIDISGFKKWEYKEVEVDPIRNYFAGLTHLGGYYPTYTGGPWQERLQLRIAGQLSENLSVTYDLEQQPEMPDRFDVKVKYYNNELTFGDFTANFSGNEFASASKFMNGVMLTAKDSWYDITTVPSAKLKSQTQRLTSQKGNNTKGPYNLGHGSIVEGSERVELNGNPLTRNVDYTIDYFEGKITFDHILTTADEFKYTYEYTNILDLFFPALSKRDFFGFQSRFTIDPEHLGKPAPKQEPILDSALETFPSTTTLEPEIMEEEASGRYRLKNTPIVRFTEKLVFMGIELKKDEDYLIRYDQGQIKLLTRFLPSAEDPLVVEYNFYQTSFETESLLGIGSRGPYQLSHPKIVPESERIEVDDKLFVRDLDYNINYETGEIVFGIVIGPTSQITAKYRYNMMALPELPPSKFPKELKIGTTYLKESAKAGGVTSTATAFENFTGKNISDEAFQIYLQNRPVVSTGESFNVIVRLDGRILTPEVDYAFPETIYDSSTGYYYTSPEAVLAFINDRADPSDGYDTGTIKIIKEGLITPTSEVSVTYTYYKSVVGRYSGVGDGGREYFLRNVRNIVPGTETLQVWEQGSSAITTYTRNSSFEPDAGDTGYSINYDADNPYLRFNNDLSATQNFQIIYQYIPPTGFISRDLSQSVLGFDGSFKIGDVFKIETAYAKSEIDRFIARVPTSESFDGDGNKTYQLNSPQDIIEDSEQVYVNEQLLNKDIDYFFSYTKPGKFTFYYITPATQDAIRVDYDYQGSTGTEITKKSDYAYKLGAETKLFGEALTINGTTKQIGFDFTPMGGTSIGLGSRYKEYNVKLKPDFHSFFTNYSYKENQNPIGTHSDYFLRSYDHSTSLGINPGGLAKIDIGFRNYETLDDIIPGEIGHKNDTRQKSYSFSIAPAEWKRGVLALNLKGDLKKTLSHSDSEKDSGAYSETNIDYYHTNTGLKFTDRFSASFDFQHSEPKTKSQKTSTIEAVETSSHTRSIDTSYTLSADLTFPAIQKWTARISLLNHEGLTLVKNFIATDEVITTKNETYHTDFTPWSILSTSLDHNRQERSTLVVGGTNPKTERTSANARLTPFSWLSGGWSWSKSESIPESGPEKKTTGNSNSYNLNWNPVSYNRFKLSTKFTLSDNEQTAPSGTAEAVKTNTNTFSHGYTINLIPHPIAPVNLGLTLENYKNKNNDLSPDNRIDTETENQTINAGITLTPNPKLSLSANHSQKLTKIIRDRKLAPQERTKTITEGKVSYQAFSWGTVVYDQQHEINGGEVQAGSVADLDFEKITQSLSLNINIPVENPVLTSFVFIASLKQVDYRNNYNRSDDFRANLTTFEGTLNF